MQEILEKVYLVFGMISTIIMYVSDFIARAFELNPENVFLIILIVLSIWSAKQILGLFYTTLEGRRSYQLILAVVIFAAIKYLGA